MSSRELLGVPPSSFGSDHPYHAQTSGAPSMADIDVVSAYNSEESEVYVPRDGLEQPNGAPLVKPKTGKTLSLPRLLTRKVDGASKSATGSRPVPSEGPSEGDGDHGKASFILESVLLNDSVASLGDLAGMGSFLDPRGTVDPEQFGVFHMVDSAYGEDPPAVHTNITVTEAEEPCAAEQQPKERPATEDAK